MAGVFRIFSCPVLAFHLVYSTGYGTVHWWWSKRPNLRIRPYGAAYASKAELCRKSDIWSYDVLNIANFRARFTRSHPNLRGILEFPVIYSEVRGACSGICLLLFFIILMGFVKVVNVNFNSRPTTDEQGEVEAEESGEAPKDIRKWNSQEDDMQTIRS